MYPHSSCSRHVGSSAMSEGPCSNAGYGNDNRNSSDKSPCSTAGSAEDRHVQGPKPEHAAETPNPTSCCAATTDLCAHPHLIMTAKSKGIEQRAKEEDPAGVAANETRPAGAAANEDRQALPPTEERPFLLSSLPGAARFRVLRFLHMPEPHTYRRIGQGQPWPGSVPYITDLGRRKNCRCDWCRWHACQ